MTELISLVLCTVGRGAPLARLLASLEAQENDAFELIVVDQSGGDEIAAQIAKFSGGRGIRHLRSEKGLSRARNVGLRHAAGGIVGFPDDDCWYDPQVTARVRRFFEETEHAVLTGRTVDRDGAESVSPHRRVSGMVARSNVFESGNSNTLFARTAVARDVGGFDETLGVGAASPFQSGEETDFLLRCLAKGYPVRYDRSFVVRHDRTEATTEPAARARAYSQGYGRVLRLHGYGFGYLAPRLVRAALTSALCLARGDNAGARRRCGWIGGALGGFFARVSEPVPHVEGGPRLSRIWGGNMPANRWRPPWPRSLESRSRSFRSRS